MRWIKMESNKQVVIQKRIDEVMREEFDKLINETCEDPLLNLIRSNKIGMLSLEEIKSYLKGEECE